MSLEKLLNTELGAALWAAGKGAIIGAFAAGVAWMGLASRVDNIDAKKADKSDVAVLIVREQLHHDEVMRAIGDLKEDVGDLRKEKADKP